VGAVVVADLAQHTGGHPRALDRAPDAQKLPSVIVRQRRVAQAAERLRRVADAAQECRDAVRSDGAR
jgi:hypothetical protein